MKNFPSYPLQTASNCVAYAYATAIETALQAYPPEYWQRIDRREITRTVGAPADVRAAAEALTAAIPWVRVALIDSPAATKPTVAATWRAGFSHAVCLVAPDFEYDPGIGGVFPAHGRGKMAAFVAVSVVAPPVANKWRRYAVYRWLENLAG